MSRSAAERLTPLDRLGTIARLEADLATFRASGSVDLADYCEGLLILIRDGALDQRSGRETRHEPPRTPPGARTGRGHIAGQKWFMKKLEPTFSSRNR
ncbi:MAG: hypothetical protein GXY82_04080 [Methanospirillum sp.]|nr:hypothetical protein [Methanospirillum sp.]